MNPPRDQQAEERPVNHLTAARNFLREVGDTSPHDKDALLRMVEVHASLAIAEQLERLNEKLGSVIGKSAKEPFGSKRYHVRTGK